jgi:hypothetical protein
LGVPAPGRAALYAKHRPKGGLAQAYDRFFAEARQSVSQTYGGGGLPFPGGGWGNGGYQNHLRMGVNGRITLYFGFIMTVWDKVFGFDV